MIEKQKAVRALAVIMEKYPNEDDWVPLAQAMGLYPYPAWDVVSDRTTRGGVREQIMRQPSIVEPDESGEVPYAADLLPRIMGKVC